MVMGNKQDAKKTKEVQENKCGLQGYMEAFILVLMHCFLNKDNIIL